MIIHASVAKLNRHMGDAQFENIMALIEAANSEGLNEYEFDVNRLNEDMIQDIFSALDEMGYGVIYHEDSEIMSVELP